MKRYPSAILIYNRPAVGKPIVLVPSYGIGNLDDTSAFYPKEDLPIAVCITRVVWSQVSVGHEDDPMPIPAYGRIEVVFHIARLAYGIGDLSKTSSFGPQEDLGITIGVQWWD